MFSQVDEKNEEDCRLITVVQIAIRESTASLYY